MSSFVAKVLTVSDGVVAGTRENRSGPALIEALEKFNFQVIASAVVADGIENVSQMLLEMAKDFEGLIVTTGGTGFGPRDLTPEATEAILERKAPGLAEAMRLVNPLGRLSRATAGTIGKTLIINTPGSSSGAIECFGAIAEVIPHALTLLSGYQPH